MTSSSWLEALYGAEMFRACEQCGECASACPLTGDNGFNVRRVLRHVELGLIDEIAWTPHPWTCTTCGRCETACPNGVAILDILRALRALGPTEERGPPPCVVACPAGIDVPGYVRHLVGGDPQAAYELILESVPFPGVLGRVCPHPCEEACRRGEVNTPVAVCALKRYAADHAGPLSEAALAVGEPTGKSVAVVGSGPAGLTAAAFLRRRGHAVTVVEARSEPGGMMRWSIPRFRLPQEVLDREIADVLALGVELRTGVALGTDISLDALRAEHDAVFVATGLQRSRRIEVEGADLDGVLWGLDFLVEVAGGARPVLGERVVVIGGGDVAVDVALTVRRLGASSVTMACLEASDQLPAHAWEVDTALAEAVDIAPSWGPERLTGEGRVTGVDLVRCTAVLDAEGRFAPTFGDERCHLPADTVILAVGQAADLDLGLPAEGGTLVADPRTGATPVSGVYAGGEIATGAGSLIEAIARGQQVAAAMDVFLGGTGVLAAWAPRPSAEGYTGAREAGFADRARADEPEAPVLERLAGFREIATGLPGEAALGEARRCLSCDLELNPERLLGS